MLPIKEMKPLVILEAKDNKPSEYNAFIAVIKKLIEVMTSVVKLVNTETRFKNRLSMAIIVFLIISTTNLNVKTIAVTKVK